jgi:hypothetical protein
MQDMLNSLTGKHIPVGIAPSRGLFLDKLFFEVYTARFGSAAEDSSAPTLDWHADSRCARDVKQFRDGIIAHITQVSVKNGTTINQA